MIKKTSSNQLCGRDSECKMVRFLSPSVYIKRGYIDIYSCPRRPGLPTYCRMVYDPMNPCCEKPDCSTPAPSPFNTVAPSPGVSTQAPSSSPYPVPKTGRLSNIDSVIHSA